MNLSPNQRAEIASHLRNHSQGIMQRWEDNLRKNAQPPLIATKLALRNSFPQMLEMLACHLESEDRTYKVMAQSGHHGKQRAGFQTYSLAQLLYEYNFLRHTIFEVLEPIFPLSAPVRNAILQAIELELSASASAFMEVRSASDRQGRLDAEAARNQAEADAKTLREERNQTLGSTEVLRLKISSLESDREIRERFVASLSHDLRNPIGASKMAADILLGMLSDTPESQPFAQILLRSLDRVETMLIDLLDISRIRAGHPIELSLAQCDLNRTITEILDVMATSKGTRFNFCTKGTICGFWSENHIRRMVENLCDNAVKYGDTNKRMTVTLNQDNKQTEIKVHNFGQLIPRADQALLFEPFNRLQAARGKTISGWGIGLTFVKGVAEAHGGNVTVRSEPEQGTTFIVTLPNDARPFQTHDVDDLH